MGAIKRGYGFRPEGGLRPVMGSPSPETRSSRSRRAGAQGHTCLT